VGVAVSFCGVALIGTQGQFSLVSFNVGDALAILSMVFWGAYTVFLRMRRDDLDTPEFMTMLCAMGLVTLLPWVAFEFARGMDVKLSARGVVAVLYSAIGSLLLAGAGWTYVVKRLGAARAGVTMHLMPAITVLMAILFLSEYPRWYHGAGIALILAGVGLSSWRRLDDRKHPAGVQ
jgi:drug/metabolite transporter (DMT)-like permease